MDSEILEKPLNSESLQQILTFLKRNGLTEAEEVLSREAAVVLRLSKEPVDGLESGNDSVVHEFGALLSHVGASFDNFRSEFSALLFPIFAHLYIQLILDGSSVIAAKLAEKYAKSVPSYYEEQTNQLIRITNHGQAANHPLVHALTKNQFVVKLSKSAIKQLEPLLARHQIIKDVIRDHFLIEPVDGSRSKVAIEANMGGILGQISKLERKHKMFYGTMKEDLSTQLGIDKKRLKGKDKSDGKKKDANGPAPDRIPLPTITDKRLLSKDGGKKVRISIDSPPSVCLYTVLNGHGGVTAAEFSEDSTMIAAGYGNSDIQVFALNEEKLKPLKKIEQLEVLDQEADDFHDSMFDESQASNSITLQGHNGPVYSTSFSPDKRLLLTSSGDATIRLWSLATRSNVVVYRQSSPVWQAQFCSRGYYFASAGSDGTAMLWATDRLQPLRIFADAFSDVTCVDFHPNCNYVVGGSDDRYVRVWDVLSGLCVRSFAGHKGSIQSVKISPCGRYIASLGAEGSLILWDVALQKMVCLQETSPFPFTTALAFSRDGMALAVSRADCALSFYSVESIINHTNSQEHMNADPRVNPKGFHLYTFLTKNTPVLGLHFTRRNLVMGVGAFNQACS